MTASRTPLMILAALAGAGLITAIDMAQSRPHDLSPAAAVAARFPTADERMAIRDLGRRAPPAAPSAVTSGKGDRQVPAGCVHEHWPYVADECLVTDGPRRNPPVRIIRIERRFADAGHTAVN